MKQMGYRCTFVFNRIFAAAAVLAAALLCILSGAFYVSAAQELVVYRSEINEENLLTVYMESPGHYDSISCRIGQEAVPESVIRTGQELMIDTYILIDNSLSIQQKYWDVMKQTAKYLVNGSRGNERFTIATFDTEPHYLVEKGTNPASLMQAIDEITFQNLDTKIIDVFYSVFEQMEHDTDGYFKRIVFMSDGVDTQYTAFTQEELNSRAKENGYPIYTLGCTFQTNASELQNLFRLSRETNAEYYFLDEAGGADRIAAEIADSFQIASVSFTIPQNQQDGANKGIQILFEGAEGEKSASLTRTMPFLSLNGDENIPGEQPEDVLERSLEDTKKSETAPAFEEQKKGIDGLLHSMGLEVLIPYKWLILAGVVMLAVLAVLLVLFIKSGKKQKKRGTSSYRMQEDDATVVLEDLNSTEVFDEDATMVSGSIAIRLFDMKHPSQIKEYTLTSPLIIGRNPERSQIVYDYERSISGQHCRLSRVRNKVFIEDLNSSNGTYVNGVLVDKLQELPNGATIGVGRLQLKFQII